MRSNYFLSIIQTFDLDESKCETVDFGDGIYHPENPDIKKGSTDVIVNVSIVFIDEIDENAMKMSIKFQIQMSWLDTRLTYRNLNRKVTYGSNLNKNQRDMVIFISIVLIASQH